MKAAPFYPGQAMSTTFAMSADDTTLHFDVDKLSPKQQKEYEESKDLMGFLQVVLIGLGKPSDYVMMYDAFEQTPWRERLLTYYSFFQRMGLDPVPPAHWGFHPKDQFYESISTRLPETDSITFYMTSRSNIALHKDPEAVRVSQNVNSKVHFAQNAPAFGIPVPDTLVTTKGQLDSAEVRDFIARHDNKLMLKILGLAGARNVTAVGSLDEAKAYVEEFDDGLEVILQQRLDLRRYTEMTADLCVTDDDIRISNVRKILFVDGIWVGNLIGPNVILTEAHREHLIRIGNYARAQGYSRPEGLNCGVDYFISDDDVVVTEINARWTGGLFPAEMIRKVGAQDQNAVVFVDLVREDKFDAYLAFIEAHLHRNGAGPFAMIPLGCSPIPQMLDGTRHYLAWQIALGDFEAFKGARRRELGDGALMRAEAIRPE